MRMLEQSLNSLAMALAGGDEEGSLAREVLLVHRDGGAGQQDAQDVNISWNSGNIMIEFYYIYCFFKNAFPSVCGVIKTSMKTGRGGMQFMTFSCNPVPETIISACQL